MRSSRNFNRREREGRRERGRENFDASQMLRPNDSVKVGEGERKEGGGCTVLLEGERERQKLWLMVDERGWGRWGLLRENLWLIVG